MLQPTGYESPAWLRLSGCVVDIDALMRGTKVASDLWHPISEIARHPSPEKFLDYLVPPPFEGSLPRRIICRQGDGPIGEHRVPPEFVFLWRELDGGPLLLIGTGNPWQWRRPHRRPPAQTGSADEGDGEQQQLNLVPPRPVGEPRGVRDPAAFVPADALRAFAHSAGRIAPIHDRLVMYRTSSHVADMVTGGDDFERLASLFPSPDSSSGVVVPARFSTAPGANLIVLSVARAFDAAPASFPAESCKSLHRPEIPAAPLPGIPQPPLRPGILGAAPSDIEQIAPRQENLAAAPTGILPTPLAADDHDDGCDDLAQRPPKRTRAPRYADLGRRAAEVARRLQPLHATVTGESTLPAIRIATLSRQPARALRVFTGRSGRQPRRLALVSVLAALAVGTLHVLSALNVARAGDLRLQLDGMSAELKEARQVAGEVHQLESLLANRASQVLSASSWIALLAALDEARPSGLHLTSVGSAVGSWVDVRGSAKSTREVTEYLASLAGTRTIDGADVTFDPDNGGVVFALRVAIDDTAEESE